MHVVVLGQNHPLVRKSESSFLSTNDARLLDLLRGRRLLELNHIDHLNALVDRYFCKANIPLIIIFVSCIVDFHKIPRLEKVDQLKDTISLSLLQGLIDLYKQLSFIFLSITLSNIISILLYNRLLFHKWVDRLSSIAKGQ